MEKKILFLRSSSGWKDPSPPMAFAYLGTIAKKKGYKVYVENLNAQYTKTTIRDVINLIKKENISIIGVSIFTNYAKYSYDLIKRIRKYCKVIIAGGPHVTIFPEEVIEKGVDISVPGEAEAMFADLLDAIVKGKDLNKVRGVIFKDKKTGKFVKTKPPQMFNIEDLPIPDKDIFRKSDYIKNPEEINNFGGILSSRGCPGRCTYCYHSLFGRCFRFMSAKRVFEEVKYLHEKYGITHIDFIDDAFTINKKRLNELLDMLIDAKLPIEWVCATRIDYLTKDIIFKMKKAGCVMISLGIESAIPETLVKMKKTGNPDWYMKQSDNVLKWCYQAKIRAGVNILTGFPWDSVEDIKINQRYVQKIKKYVTQGFCGGVLQPLPNTEVYDEYKDEFGFENWWLNKEPIFSEDYHPFFMTYYHPFYEQLHNDFFNLDKSVFREIDKLYKMMGKWNLYIITKRRFKNPILLQFVYLSFFVVSNISIGLYNISPKLEKIIMRQIKNISYKFRYKK